jgi:hypothetical protein
MSTLRGGPFVRELREECLAVDFERSEDAEQYVEAGAVFPLLEAHEVGGLEPCCGGEVFERQTAVLTEAPNASPDELHGAIGRPCLPGKGAMPRNHRS